MDIDYLSGPVIHVGVCLVLGLLFRLNLAVIVLCGILPDLVDKPLAAMGIGGGRYIGHTLLFAVVISGAFFLWKKKYGLAAIIGLLSHLLLDLNNFIPWFYPFKDYNFSDSRFDFIEWIHQYLGFSRIGYELIGLVVVGLLAFIGWRLYRRHLRGKV